MTNRTSPSARLLFVIDNDYGSLGMAMYLLYRQPLAARATLLLPGHAYELHKGKLLIASHPYQSLQDVLNIVEIENPDVVCLLSGYFSSSQHLLTIHTLRKLIRTLRRRGCKVATSDPYLGTFRQIANANASAMPSVLHQNLNRLLLKLPRVDGLVAQYVRYYKKKKLERFLRRVADSLKGITQIYPVPMEPLPAGGIRSMSFYNPLYIRSQDDLRRISATVSTFPDIAAREPRWLFVLAQFDLEFQEKQYGKQGFVHIVASKLRQALDNGKHPTLIGPAAIIDEVSRHFAPDSGVSFLPCCSFEEFEQRLLDAEVAFYWQIFSTSAFLRLWNGLPVFFFDQGHNARILRPLREAGLRYYYTGGSPIHLDIEKPLDAATLAELLIRFRQSAHVSRQRLARLPTPAEMVSTIMNTA